MKTKIRTNMLLLILAASIASWSAAGPADPAVTFEAARHKQMVEGDLQKAIALYERVVDQSGANRSLAARALLEIGVCYEKLGQEEARRAYTRLVREYADQQPQVVQARTRLAALNGTGAPAASSARDLLARQVWADKATDASGTPSPDGRYLSYVNWMTANLAVRDLKNGTTRDVTDEGAWGSRSQWAYNAIWSPDGKQLAYAWYINDECELRTVPLAGGPARVLFRSADGGAIRPYVWTSDGDVIVRLRRPDRSFELAKVSASGEVRTLKQLGRARPLSVSLSPNGRLLLYDINERPGAQERDIRMMALDGSRELGVVTHAATDYGPMWTPAGDAFVFASDRGGTVGLWLQKMTSTGAPEGAPVLLKPDMGRMVPLGFARNGTFFYGFSTFENAGDIYTARVDVAGAALKEPPARTINRFIDGNTSPGYSSDGRYMAYLSRRGVVPLGAGSWSIIVRDTRTGSERELRPPELDEINNPRRAPLRWSPDGSRVLVAGSDVKGQYGLYGVQVSDGAASLLLPFPASMGNSAVNWPQWTGDGKGLVTVHPTVEGGRLRQTIVRRDLATGSETSLAPGAVFAVSPDAKRVAYRWFDPGSGTSGISVVPIGGGEPVEVARLSVKDRECPDTVVETRSGITWTPDGKHVIFGRGNGEDDKIDLWRVDVAAGDLRPLGISGPLLRDLSMHPDGQQLTYTQSAAFHAEIWALENLLPDKSSVN